MAQSKILIIEDDRDIREGVGVLLMGEDYEVLEAEDGARGLALLDDTCDLVILDVMMPGMSGIECCKEIRRRRSTVPILFLSAKSQEADKALGLLSGGDDYLAKPFSYMELLARVKALLRRYHIYQGKDGEDFGQEIPTVVRGDFALDLRAGVATKSGRPVDLTDTEYGILSLLAAHPGAIYSAKQIYEAVWDEPYDRSVNATLMVHISRLRNKIEQDLKDPRLIKTVWGRGYRFV